MQPVTTNTFMQAHVHYKAKGRCYFPLTIDTSYILDDHIHPCDIKVTLSMWEKLHMDHYIYLSHIL